MTYTNLQSRRIASFCLNAICHQHHLGSKAHKFMADQFSDWSLRSDWEIFALIDDEQVAEVYLTASNADIIIPNWWAIIRREHLGEFNPEEHSIQIENANDPVSNLKYNDGEYLMTFSTDDIPGYKLPEANIPRHVGGRRPRVIASR